MESITSSASTIQTQGVPLSDISEINIKQEFKSDRKNCCTPEKYVYISSAFSVLTGIASIVCADALSLFISIPSPSSCYVVICSQLNCDNKFGRGNTTCTGTDYYANNFGTTGAINTTPPGYQFEYLSIALAVFTLGISLFSVIKTSMIQKRSSNCRRLWWITIPSNFIGFGCAIATFTIASLALTKIYPTYVQCNSTAPLVSSGLSNAYIISTSPPSSYPPGCFSL